MYGMKEFNGELWGDLGDGCWLCGSMIVSMQANDRGTWETPEGKYEWSVSVDSDEVFRLTNTDTEETYRLYREELAEILFNEFAKG